MSTTITDNAIRKLRDEALWANDQTMVEMCSSALRGNEDHRRHCQTVIEHVRGLQCASNG